MTLAWGGVSHDQICSAVCALKKSNETGLWADDSPVQLTFGFQKVTEISTRLRPKLIDVPHQILPEKAEVCLIVRDNCPPALLSDLKSRLGKVITLKKLIRNYRENESRSQLCGSFDLFLHDKRIAAHVIPYRCGKVFMNKKKPCVNYCEECRWSYE